MQARTTGESARTSAVDDDTASSWTSLDEVLATADARVRSALGARHGHLAMQIEDDAAMAAAVERFARELAALSVRTRVERDPSDIGWHDDPPTEEHPPAELDRWRRMAADDTTPPRQSVVLGTLKKATPVPPEKRGPWARSDSEPPPADDHLPLLHREEID